MTPWELVKKSEHSHQRALFAWVNCAALYGFRVADDPRAYVKAEREKMFADGYGIMPRPDLTRLFAIHNQGHGDVIRGARAKAEGVKAGAPDLMLPVPRRIARTAPPDMGVVTDWYHGLFIELKRPGGTATAVQSDWIAYLTRAGYRCAVCVGWEAARAVIVEYMS